MAEEGEPLGQVVPPRDCGLALVLAEALLWRAAALERLELQAGHRGTQWFPQT